MTPKVLIYVDDGQIDVMHTRGVEVAVIIEGEDVEIPDDWVGLLGRQHHSLPITVNRSELPSKRALQCPETQLAAPNTQVQHATARLSEEKPTYGELLVDKAMELTQAEIEELNEKEEQTRRNVAANLMKHPYCFDCGDNHLPGECPAS